MKLGLNLSFAVKRFLEPDKLARMCKQDFGTDHVQFTWDLIDPWWPEELRDVLAIRYKEAFAKEGVHIDATFGGLASYSYAPSSRPFKGAERGSLPLFQTGCRPYGSDGGKGHGNTGRGHVIR